ncbi:MAG TPA: ABC transporter substrate-binding protein [Candidatus Blautia intestinavium]|nr:ABC transporter substrate-binding protein [Candidatus Blautia intestinavium]
MKKRVVAALLCGVMVAGSLSVSAQSALADEGTTITVMASQDWVYDAEMELGKQFEEETGIKVDYQIVPADQYYNMLMTKLNSGEGPDIFGGQSGSFDIVSQYNVEKNAVDLSDQAWVETYDEFAKEQTSVDGKVYGMTYYDVSTDYYVVYNKKIFEENGLEVPTTYAEFEEICQTLLDNDIIPIYEPCADGWHQTMWFTEIGGKYEELVPGIVDDLNNNKIKFADVPELKEALDQLNDMAQKGYFGDNYLSDEYTDLLMNLGSGEYAMALEKPGQIAAIAEASDGQYTEDDFGMFVIPLLDNDVYPQHPCGPSRFVYSGSEHQEEAKQYLEYIASADSVQYMIDNCDKIENLPFDVGQTPSYSEATQTFLDAAEKEGTVFQDSIKYLNPQWTELTQDIVSMFIGDMTSEDVLNAIDERRATQAEAVGDENWQ